MSFYQKALRGCFATGFAVLIAVAAVAPVRPQTKTTAPFAFSRGEELVYQAEFSRGLLRGVDVGEFRFTAITENISRGAGKDEPAIVRLTGDVKSKGFFLRLVGFSFHQRVESVAGLEPFTVLKTKKLEEQGKRVRDLDAVFDHDARKVTWTIRDPNQNQPPQISTIDFAEPIQDVLTVIYFLRTRQLEPGKSFEVPLSDAGRVQTVTVKAAERRELNTVLGRVKTIRIEPGLFGDTRLVKAHGTFSIWLTDDDRHIPVKAQLKIDIGTFDIKLKRVSDFQPQ